MGAGAGFEVEEGGERCVEVGKAVIVML